MMLINNHAIKRFKCIKSELSSFQSNEIRALNSVNERVGIQAEQYAHMPWL